MAAALFLFIAVDANGSPLSGAKMPTKAAGTSTDLPVYTDSGLTTPATNPAIANSVGIFKVYTDTTKAYDFTITNSAGSYTVAQGTVPSGGDPIIFTHLPKTAYDANEQLILDIYDDIAIVAANDVDISVNADNIAAILTVSGAITDGTLGTIIAGLDAKATTGTYSALRAVALANAATLTAFTVIDRGPPITYRWQTGDQSTPVAADEMTSDQGDGGLWVAPTADKTGASGAWKAILSDHIPAAAYGLSASASRSVNTAAVVAAAKAARATGQTVKIAPGGPYDLDNFVCYFGLDIRGAHLRFDQDAADYAPITIGYIGIEEIRAGSALPADAEVTHLSDGDKAALAGAVKGQTYVAGLAAYRDKHFFLNQVDSIARLIRRSGRTDYRYTDQFVVVTDEGDIQPPLIADVPAAGFANAWMVDIKAPVYLQAEGARIEVNSGATPLTAIIELARPNACALDVEIENTSGVQILSGILCSGAYNHAIRCSVNGLDRSSSNYGFNNSGLFAVFEDCHQKQCRRGLDGSYAKQIKIVRGTYPDGVGMHLGWGLDIDGASVGGNALGGNPCPIHVAGADVTARNSTIVMRHTGTGLMNMREDVPTLGGTCGFENCRIVFDNTSNDDRSAGVSLFDFSATSYDTEKPIYIPDLIFFRNNRVTVIDSNDTLYLRLIGHLGWSGAQVQNINTILDVGANTWSFSSGLTTGAGVEKIRFEYVKNTSETGSGVRGTIRDVPAFFMDVRAVSGASDSDCRVVLDIATEGQFRGIFDYGALKSVKAWAGSRAAAFTNMNSYTPIGDEVISLLYNQYDPTQPRRYTVADDAVLDLPLPTLHGSFRVTVDTFMQGCGEVRYDANGGTVSISGEGGTSFATASGTPTGTTGTDGKVTAFVATSHIYIENRSGASINLRIYWDAYDGALGL